MIDWHSPRTELAEQFLDTFDTGTASTLTLFAPLRMGKTEFLLNDLIPMAVDRGYRPVYANFWQFERDPVACLQGGIEQSLTGKGRKAKLRRALARAPEVEAGVEGIGHIKLTQKVKSVHQQDLQNLQESFAQLLRGRKRVLLCLDEVQHLATRSEFEPLVFFLRTLIDTHRDKLKVIFTGSSRDGLQKLFTRRKAPLFNTSAQIDLPELGSPFVAHILKAFTEATGREIDHDRAMTAFRRLSKVPYRFRICVDSLMRLGDTDILAQAKAFQSETTSETDHETLWESLKPIDQAVLRRLAENGRGVYHDESRQQIADLIGLEEPIPPHVVQSAINRMRGDIIAPTGHGVWDFEDPGLKHWVLEQLNTLWQ